MDDPSDDLFSRLVTDEDIKHARAITSAVERSITLAVRSGTEIKAVDVAKEFKLDERIARRLVERIKTKHANRSPRKKRPRKTCQ